jgi:hypothetical protein
MQMSKFDMSDSRFSAKHQNTCVCAHAAFTPSQVADATLAGALAALSVADI